MRDELAIGGYAHNEIIVRLNAQTSLEQQVTITDVKIVDLVAAEPARGALVNLVTCGGDPTNGMVIHINGPDRQPFAMNEYRQETDRHFFDTEVVNVAPGKKQSFVVRVVVDNYRAIGSYTFRLAFSYEVDGKQSQAIVDNNGQPFRLTGGCDWTSYTASQWVGQDEPIMQQYDRDRLADLACN